MNWKYNEEGEIEGSRKYDELDSVKAYRRQLKLAGKRQLRRDIADMCGTSYAAACRDMGLSRQ